MSDTHAALPARPTTPAPSSRWDDVQTESQLRRRAASLHWQAIGAAAEADHRAETLAQRRVGYVHDRDYQDSLAQVEALRQHAADLAAEEQLAIRDLDTWQQEHSHPAAGTPARDDAAVLTAQDPVSQYVDTTPAGTSLVEAAETGAFAADAGLQNGAEAVVEAGAAVRVDDDVDVLD